MILLTDRFHSWARIHPWRAMPGLFAQHRCHASLTSITEQNTDLCANVRYSSYPNEHLTLCPALYRPRWVGQALTAKARPVVLTAEAQRQSVVCASGICRKPSRAVLFRGTYLDNCQRPSQRLEDERN